MKVVYTPCCVCGAPSTDRIRREEDGKTVEIRYYCQPCVEREWQRLLPPCEDCGHAPCDCDQMRAADELLYGGEEEAGYLSDDDGFDEPHGEECCCEDCLQDYPERDALYNDCQFYGVPDDTAQSEVCRECFGAGGFHHRVEDGVIVETVPDCLRCGGTGREPASQPARVRRGRASAMRTEAEIRVMLARLIDEHGRAMAEGVPNPIRVTEIGTATYQITMRQTAAMLAQSINLLRWTLGEIDIPDTEPDAHKG